MNNNERVLNKILKTSNKLTIKGELSLAAIVDNLDTLFNGAINNLETAKMSLFFEGQWNIDNILVDIEKGITSNKLKNNTLTNNNVYGIIYYEYLENNPENKTIPIIIYVNKNESQFNDREIGLMLSDEGDIPERYAILNVIPHDPIHNLVNFDLILTDIGLNQLNAACINITYPMRTFIEYAKSKPDDKFHILMHGHLYNAVVDASDNNYRIKDIEQDNASNLDCLGTLLYDPYYLQKNTNIANLYLYTKIYDDGLPIDKNVMLMAVEAVDGTFKYYKFINMVDLDTGRDTDMFLSHDLMVQGLNNTLETVYLDTLDDIKEAIISNNINNAAEGDVTSYLMLDAARYDTLCSGNNGQNIKILGNALIRIPEFIQKNLENVDIEYLIASRDTSLESSRVTFTCYKLKETQIDIQDNVLISDEPNDLGIVDCNTSKDEDQIDLLLNLLDKNIDLMTKVFSLITAKEKS